MSNNNSSFVDNLPKIYGIYTGGFVLFVVALAIAEQLGLGKAQIGWIFMAATILLYAVIGVMSRTQQAAEYYVAGRRVPAIFNGMATGADWMSAASFLGMAGSLYALGFDGSAFLMGWTGGYVLVALFLAPYLRKFGQFTIPDFLGARYGGNIARIIGIIAAITASFTYVVAQITGAGYVTSFFLGIQFEYAVFVGLAGILVCSMLGGMRAVTWTQVAQYIILIVAYMVPIVWLSIQLTGNPIPQIAYGNALEQIQALEAKFGIAVSHLQAFAHYDPINFMALVFCLMIGTASLPHILMRFYTTPSVREARASVAWSLFFIFLLYFSAPALAALAKLQLLDKVYGAVSFDASWIAFWQNLGIISATDLNANGILDFGELTLLKKDAIVLLTPELAGMPYVVGGLVGAGALAAALSTADGLLLTISNSLSHDLYYKIINPKASTSTRLLIARVILIMVAGIAAYVASLRLSDILSIVAWAFSLAGSAFFPALVLGIFWKRANATGAVIGMLVGFGVSLFYLMGAKFNFWIDPELWKFQLWFNIKDISAGIFGIPIGFATIIIVSLLTKPPSEEVQNLVEQVRYPNIPGETKLETD